MHICRALKMQNIAWRQEITSSIQHKPSIISDVGGQWKIFFIVVLEVREINTDVLLLSRRRRITCHPFMFHFSSIKPLCIYCMLSLGVYGCMYMRSLFMLCCTQLRVYESESLPEMITYKQTKVSILLPCSQYVVETLSAFTQESIYSSSHHAQLKITTSKCMRHIYKT